MASVVTFAPVTLSLKDGREVLVRTIRSDDEHRLQDAVRALSKEARYTRFMSPLRELPPSLLERAVHSVGGGDLQLVAVTGTAADEVIVAGARYSSEPGAGDCEFAIALRDEWQGAGLARRLLELLIGHAAAEGFAGMEGFILASNTRMLGLAAKLGFVRVASPEGPMVHKVWLDLHARS